MSVRKSVKAAPKIYRWYGVGDEDVKMFDGSGPPTKTYTREVYGPDATGDVDIKFVENDDCEFIDYMEYDDFAEKAGCGYESDSGMLYRGPVPDPDEDEIEEYDEDDIPEERELSDCQD